MFYIYGKDYIKYLNDETAGRMTYEQWQDKNLRQKIDQSIKSDSEKNAENKFYQKKKY